MDDYKDYYVVLGLNQNVTASKIETAYKKLTKEIASEIKKCHPFRCPSDEQARVRYLDLKKSRTEINEAYHLLKNPAVRSDYKELGFIPLEKHGYFKNRNNVVEQVNNAQMDITFSSMFGSQSGLFGRTSDEIREHDILVAEGTNCFAAVELTEGELNLGAQKKVSYNRNVYCPHCGGKGYEGNETPESCMECHGKGSIIKEKKFIIKMSSSKRCKKCNGIGVIYQNACPQCKGSRKISTGCSVTVSVPTGSIYGGISKIELQGNEGNHGNFGDLYVQFVMPGSIWK